MDKTATITRDEALSLLRRMRLIRQASERIAKLYPTDVMQTPIHLCIGQEAVAAGVCHHLGFADQLYLGHRTHGPALAKGLPLQRLMAELYGRTTGCSGGFGGSMHVYDPAHGLPGSSAIVGGSIALAVGAGLAAKLQRAPWCGVAWFGDAATNAGVCYESMNFAALRKLPVLFVCEDNGFSNVMPRSAHSAHDIESLARVLMPTFPCDGTDALAVRQGAAEALALVRGGQGPAFLHCRTKRWMKHMSHEVCDLPENVVDRERDCPIHKLEQFLLRSAMASVDDFATIHRELETEIDAAIAFATASPFPTPDLLEV
jgi:acetoin:2,6-dichlorophenolindophenol oxidoreductase subunit alpha